MTWKLKYAMRVEGLGDVGILFLPHAVSDDEARSQVALSDKCDPRRTTTAIYRIECLIDELGDKDTDPLPIVRGRATRGIFILTGSKDKKSCDDVFAAEGAFDAIGNARARTWTKIRLYQAEEVDLS